MGKVKRRRTAVRIRIKAREAAAIIEEMLDRKIEIGKAFGKPWPVVWLLNTHQVAALSQEYAVVAKASREMRVHGCEVRLV